MLRQSRRAARTRRSRIVLLSDGISGREIAERVGIFKLTSATVSKFLRAHGLKPHLVRTYKVSRDPAFAAKVKDVVGLYSIQALERSQLPLPLPQGRAAPHTRDYERHGVLDLYAALNVATGEVAHVCHRPPHDGHFHYTPSSGSWLNQVEGFFGILAKQSLRATDFLSKKQLREHIAAYITHWNAKPSPFMVH